MIKTGLLLGSFLAFLTVVLGAFGAHALKEQLSEYGKIIYEKGILYQMFHSLAIIMVAILNQNSESIDYSISIWCFAAGIAPHVQSPLGGNLSHGRSHFPAGGRRVGLLLSLAG